MMRLTKGAITNLIANYKSVLSKMYHNNSQHYKKRLAALLACMMMTASAPGFAAVSGDVTVEHKDGSSTSYTTLSGISTLADGDTVIFKTKDGQTMTGAISITQTGDVLLTFEGNVTITNNAVSQFIVTGNATPTKLTLIAANSSHITIDGFKGDGGAIQGNANSATAAIVIGEVGSTGTFTFSNNVADQNQNGGAIAGNTVTVEGNTNTFIGNIASASGGAIAGTNAVTIQGDSSNEFIGNEAALAGGAIVGTNMVTIQGESINWFEHNKSNGTGGGAIQSDVVLIKGSSQNIFKNNTAKQSGGAIVGTNTVRVTGESINLFENNSATSNNGSGGAIVGTDVLIDGSSQNTFINNTAKLNGGAIAGVFFVTIDGSSANWFKNNQANSGDGGGAIQSGETITLSNSGGAGFEGTGIDGKTIAYDNVFIENISSASGGAIMGQEVIIIDSNNFFQGNTSTKDGGAIGSSFIATSDGGINSGIVTLTNSTTLFDANSSSGSGGAIAGGGAVTFDGSVVAFTDNKAGKDGGAIATQGDLVITNGADVYFSGNTARSDNTSAVIANNIAVTDSTITGEGGFLAKGTAGTSGEITITNSTINLEGTIDFWTNKDESLGDGATLKDVTLTGSGTLGGGDIKLDSDGDGGLKVNTDSIITIAAIMDLDGNTLTKNGDGTLIFTHAQNKYDAGTLNINKGDLTIKLAQDLSPTPQAVLFDNIVNRSRLNFTGATPDSYYQKHVAINTYTGGANSVLGLQTSWLNPDKTQNWVDSVLFKNFSASGSTIVHFDIEPGSTPNNIPDEGLAFAVVENGTVDEKTFVVDKSIAQMGAYTIGIDYDADADAGKTYSLNKYFDSHTSKVYSEVAVGALGQASGMHGQGLLKATGEAAHGSGNNITGVFAGLGRDDSRLKTGSHADVKGNTFAIALGFKANEKTAWGLFVQMFDGSYDTETGNSINSHGDMASHDFGLFVEYRPEGQNELDAGRYYKGIVRAGRVTSDFRANNFGSTGYTDFSIGRNLFGLSVGGGYVKALESNNTVDYYGHLIYTNLNGSTVTDSIGQEVKFGSSNSFRLLAGTRLNFNSSKRASTYLGAALDCELGGAGDSYIDGFKADKADLKGLTGMLEVGVLAKLDDKGTAVNLGLQGYVGKRQGLGGTFMFSKYF